MRQHDEVEDAIMGGSDESVTTREIRNQVRLWRETAEVMRSSCASLHDFLTPILSSPSLRVVLTGAGSSAYAGAIVAPGLRRRLGRPVDAIPTTDLIALPLETLAGEGELLVVSFARSGDSPESAEALRLVDALHPGAWHLAITCNEAGALHRTVDGHPRGHSIVLPPDANDRAFAMTSSFTCMTLSALVALSQQSPDDLDALAADLEALLPELSLVAERWGTDALERFVFLGSGALQAAATEAALKVMELTAGRVVGLAETPLAFRHGPKAFLSDRAAAFVMISSDPHARAYDLDLLEELAGEIGGRAIGIAIGRTAGSDAVPLWTLDASTDATDESAAVLFVVFAQLLGVQLALSRGVVPDDPFPGGEVNRVVQGVTIHPARGPLVAGI